MGGAFADEEQAPVGEHQRTADGRHHSIHALGGAKDGGERRPDGLGLGVQIGDSWRDWRALQPRSV